MPDRPKKSAATRGARDRLRVWISVTWDEADQLARGEVADRLKRYVIGLLSAARYHGGTSDAQ